MWFRPSVCHRSPHEMRPSKCNRRGKSLGATPWGGINHWTWHAACALYTALDLTDVFQLMYSQNWCKRHGVPAELLIALPLIHQSCKMRQSICISLARIKWYLQLSAVAPGTLLVQRQGATAELTLSWITNRAYYWHEPKLSIEWIKMIVRTTSTMNRSRSHRYIFPKWTSLSLDCPSEQVPELNIRSEHRSHLCGDLCVSRRDDCSWAMIWEYWYRPESKPKAHIIFFRTNDFTPRSSDHVVTNSNLHSKMTTPTRFLYVPLHSTQKMLKHAQNANHMIMTSILSVWSKDYNYIV